MLHVAILVRPEDFRPNVEVIFDSGNRAGRRSLLDEAKIALVAKYKGRLPEGKLTLYALSTPLTSVFIVHP